MKSGTRKLNYRARTNKKHTYKVLKRGGAAGKEISGNTFARFGIPRYLAHSLIIKDYFISRITRDCSSGVIINFINKGNNGFILHFKCDTDTKAIKILFNETNPLEDIDSWKHACSTALIKEYANIALFNDSKYIIKAYGYFIFDGSEFVCSGTKDYNKSFQPTRTINDGVTYKVVPIPPKVVPGTAPKKASTVPILEPFGGIILEYINHSLRNIRVHLESFKGAKAMFYIDRIPDCVYVLIDLFYQYLLGITKINESGYVHTDIKVDNLMYEQHPTGFTAKIVDLANIKEIEKVSDLTSNSKAYHAKQYHLGAIERLKGMEAKRVDLRSLAALKKRYLERYDLYCLCVTFSLILEELKPHIFNFDEALTKCEEGAKLDKEKAAKLAEKKTKLAEHKAIFKLFEVEITKIKDISNDSSALYSLDNIPSNSEFSSFILKDCIIKMYKDYST